MASRTLSQLGIPLSASSNQFDFRVVVQTFTDTKFSYFTSSFIDLDQTTTISASNALNRIGTMNSCSYLNSPNFRRHPSSSIHTDGGGSPNLYWTVGSNPLSCSLSGSDQTGSLVFKQKLIDDPVKRYKFFGSTVCRTFGIPEDVWIYSDDFRLSTKKGESNFMRGNVIADQLQVMKRINFSNVSTVNSDLTFRIDTGSQAENSRYIKFIDYSSEIPTNSY